MIFQHSSVDLHEPALPNIIDLHMQAHRIKSRAEPAAIAEGMEEGQPFISLDVGGSENTREVERPPDGGVLAWLQVVGSFVLWFNSW